MEKDLNYLLTSDFDEGFKPEEYIKLLNQFRYEYRLLHGKCRSLEQQIDKLNGENENYKSIIFEIDTKYLTKIANLEDKITFLTTSLNKKLTWSERFKGKINRK